MEQYHPVIQFIFFCSIIGCSMFFMHPVCLAISLVTALLYAFHLFDRSKMCKALVGVGGLMLITALINPAFSHQGVTVIMYLPTGNVLTLESILYGMAAACMMAAVLLWFRCMSVMITADKIVYLFGRFFPVSGMVLSMALGFIPKLQRKLREIVMARGEKKQLRHGIETLSVLVTWTLEDAVETADSMKSRGYGLPGRTAFTIYRFTKRDRRCMLLLLLEIGYILAGKQLGGLEWHYYPDFGGVKLSLYPVSIFLVYLLLCLTPLIIDKYEEKKWNRLQSEI